MLEVDIPGFGPLRLRHLVPDQNGTVAVDGALIEGVAARLATLASRMTLHVAKGQAAHRPLRAGGRGDPERTARPARTR